MAPKFPGDNILFFAEARYGLGLVNVNNDESDGTTVKTVAYPSCLVQQLSLKDEFICYKDSIKWQNRVTNHGLRSGWR